MKALFIVALAFTISSFSPVEQSYHLRDIQFNINSDSLADSQLKELQFIIRTIRESMVEGKQQSFTLWINGNSDNSEVRPVRLSRIRAKVVANKLKELGLVEGMVIVKGFGTKRPIANASTEDGRKRNARVDFQIILE